MGPPVQNSDFVEFRQRPLALPGWSKKPLASAVVFKFRYGRAI